jgi:hypothetical protein
MNPREEDNAVSRVTEADFGGAVTTCESADRPEVPTSIGHLRPNNDLTLGGRTLALAPSNQTQAPQLSPEELNDMSVITESFQPSVGDILRVIDPDEYLLHDWDDICSALDDEDARGPAEQGPEALLQFLIDRAFITSTTVEWEIAPRYEDLEPELQEIITDLVISIGRSDRYLSAPRCPCCGVPMLDRTDGPIPPSPDGNSLSEASEGASLDGGFSGSQSDEADEGDEEPEENEEMDECNVRCGVQWCARDLFTAMQTSVWLGRLGHVQALAHAIGRLDDLLVRMVDRSYPPARRLLRMDPEGPLAPWAAGTSSAPAESNPQDAHAPGVSVLEAVSQRDDNPSQRGFPMKKVRHSGPSVEYVIGPGWLHTHGMDAAGLPELEMRHVPAFLAEAAAGLLREVCDYMLETGRRIESGHTMSTSSRTRFKFVTPEPMQGDEDHYESERLQIVDHEPLCDCCGFRAA